MNRIIQNLLVTGGCGFIGTNFIRYILNQPEFSGRIINVDKLTYAGNPFNLESTAEDYPDRYSFIEADICDYQKMTGIFADFAIDGVCHFAAESHVDRSITGPAPFIQSNISGTFTLLEVARSAMNQLNIFHHISTDEVYGSLGSQGKFTETSPFQPNSPYAASKAAADHLARAYYQTYGLPVTISNCSNNYGPYQFPEKLIPLTILHILAGKELPVYGDGLNIRDWLHVKDHCQAVWLIMQQGKPGQTYNIGGNTEYTNIDLVQRLCDLVDDILDNTPGTSRQLIRFVSDRPGHDRRYAIDSSKICRELNWSPKIIFNQGLLETVNWYRANQQWVRQVKSGEYRV